MLKTVTLKATICLMNSYVCNSPAKVYATAAKRIKSFIFSFGEKTFHD